MLCFVHSNPALVRDGRLRIDRKFLTGMQRNAETIGVPLLTIHPTLDEAQAPMDTVEVPLASLPYRVMTVPAAGPLPDEVRAQVEASALVYGSLEWGIEPVVRAARIPYVLVLEYDLDTQIVVTTSQVTSPLRRLVRKARCTADFHRRQVPQMRGATALHCNGFPVYDESARYNTNRVLYLDSRMSADMVISEERLQSRLAKRRAAGPLKLLFSGRYEPMKGALDSVRVAVACQQRGLDIVFHSYGQGSQREAMRALAAQAPRPERIVVHDAIPYPELVERSRDYDVFVCCHVQSDPSCTYLESFGSGLPIVGYANRMWARLADESSCGIATPLGDPAAVAAVIAQWQADPAGLDARSLKASQFARQHTFEREFALRTDAIKATLESVRRPSAAAA